MYIHSSAIIDKDAKLGEGVKIGPFSIIGPNVTIGDKTEIAANVHIVKNTSIGNDCKISSGAVLGDDPQILNFKEEGCSLKIGNGNVIREYVTIHLSSNSEKLTQISNNCYLMACTHIAHDCFLDDEVIITNYTGLPGHVTIGKKAIISGYVGMHQFIRIGKYAMVSGMSRLPKDVLPFSMVEGNPVRVLGINAIGLRRAGIKPSVRSDLKKAIRLFSGSGLNTIQALEKIKEDLNKSDELNHLIEFIETSKRGVCK